MALISLFIEFFDSSKKYAEEDVIKYAKSNILYISSLRKKASKLESISCTKNQNNEKNDWGHEPQIYFMHLI
ncbi:hypothetical protein BpHYR1_019084 [Brachionus plicatilis]|uniref:Uncharacterized protein n=1 Tax=Brachionus plicatilis TaxID=10195 RepID=A0A3M7RZF7_BRAPC|nr:hypothetical protein BpHYR1_019084 [Brachionus plicatilis]